METEFWAVWESTRRYFAADVTNDFRQAVTGGLARQHGSPLTYPDIHAWLIPGLAALGVQAELLPLPEEATLSGRILRSAATPVFAFSGPIDAAPPEEEGMPEDETPEDLPEPTVARQGLWLEAMRTEKLRWRHADGTEAMGAWEEFQEQFSHVLLVRKATRKGLRREHLQAALLRWAAYSDAYPDRIPTNADADASLRALAASFLHSVAGKQRDRVANRLRWAAEAYERGDVTLGIAFLRMAVVQALALPNVVQAALLSDPGVVALSDIERRELIYLARAGTRDLKVLAARRLTSEAHQADVQSTLKQLRYDPDPWVRAVGR